MRCRPLLFVVLCALLALRGRVATAQGSDTIPRASGATVSGVVHDSLARTPLAGATVQLVGANRLASFSRTTASDSLGRYTLADVPEGRYMLGFFHPMLDSLGVEAPLHAVVVQGSRPVRADLAIPGPAQLRAAICAGAESGAVVVGVVRDARDRAPIADAAVTGQWLELSFTAAGLVRRTPRLVATTGAAGWFALCNAPSGGTMTLMASRGADSTDLIEVQVPEAGFLRRELSLGPARTIVVGSVPADTTPRADSLALPPRRRRVGDGRLSGTVVAAAGGRPLVGAQVSLADGPRTRANERGEWTLADAPVGTRMLEVRAVGYYPERRPVEVGAGSAPLRVALSTLQSVLDTVRVTAARRVYDRDRSGFQQRSRSGAGRYLTADDIARRGPLVTTDLFRMMPGVRLDRSAFDSTSILVRGMGAEWCAPAIYLDGHYMPGISADEVDAWAAPKEIMGIEIYSSTPAPPQYQQAFSGCGSIVIWTR